MVVYSSEFSKKQRKIQTKETPVHLEIQLEICLANTIVNL